MAANSTMLALGTKCPDFTLENAVDGQTVSPIEYAGKSGLLVMFICNHCPYVVHVHDEFKKLEDEFAAKGLAILAINSNSERTHPQDGPANMKLRAKEKGWGFPFLFDRTQSVARAFQAACTPEFYLFDGAQKLVYRGRLDESSPKNGKPVTGKDLREAIVNLLEKQPITSDQLPSVGCSIKWD